MPTTPPITGTVMHFDTASLHVVKPEIDLSLQQVENALTTFIDDPQNVAGLFEGADTLLQIHGILRLLELHGASELANAMAQLLRQHADQPSKAKEQQLSIIGEGLMLLSRYLEFILLRETALPHLLLPITNTLRQAAHLPLLSESYFLQSDFEKININNNGNLPQFLLNPAKRPLIDFLHRMYQSGFAKVLKRHAQARDLQLIQRACQEMADLSTHTQSALYWQSAYDAVADLAQVQPLSASRLRVLVHIERQLAQPEQAIPIHALRDVVAFAARQDHSHAQRLRQELQLDQSIITDQTTTELSRFLFGPDGEVIHTVTDLVHEEINLLKNSLDSISHMQVAGEHYNQVADQLMALGQTLTLLSQSAAAEQIKQQAAQVRVWQQTPNQQQLNLLMDALLMAENATTLLAKSYTPGVIMLPLNNMRISLYQLDDACRTLITESRGTLGLAMRSLLSLIESDGDMLHMENVPVMLISVSGALEFLNLPRGRDILKTTATYISSLFGADMPMPSKQVLGHLADTLSCIDYYLESIEAKQPAGERAFEVGEQSLALLGAA